MGFIASIFFGFFPMLVFAGFIYWLDRYEKEPKILIGFVFAWGAIITAIAAFLINTLLGVSVLFVTGSEVAAEFTTGSLFAPFIEESFKGFAVLLVFLIFRKEFDSILDGIVYASVVALGFAATENTYYIYSMGYLEEGWEGLSTMVFIRDFVVSWQHPFYTSFIGIGLAISRMNKNLLYKICAPILGWAIALFTHSFHNTLSGVNSAALCFIGSILDWSGWFLMFIFILWNINYEKNLVKKYVKLDFEAGYITAEQYDTACSAIMQNIVRISALFQRSFKVTNRFYNVCGEIAHKRKQFEKLGEETENSIIIHNLQNELKRLSPLLKS
ncbi:MAG: PrsW family intramembrane metalloprotease [Anaerolineaceae bacterium]|nr:PrsW family intramembrane metalloprotease [Anaerolineaceae bacterium]